MSNKSLEWMAFVNENWGNLLRRVDEHGKVVENVPVALRGLYWSDFRYLCRVMTFSSWMPSVPSQSLYFPCVSGHVSIYRSRLSLKSNAGHSDFKLDHYKTNMRQMPEVVQAQDIPMESEGEQEVVDADAEEVPEFEPFHFEPEDLDSLCLGPD
ncbi:hypothetical protein EMPS_07785 [Entomortierella parvispora]|uniref:Uncharacterized protein n=1 Tax=Entomortierella parvispora TaxID=205924 RepID=A0A9P3LYS0_9FUNG|nr:hypothetical protein EMPS_07785 [Entomortierella parvispora]